MMTVDEVRAALAKIRAQAEYGDNEAAHGTQDELFTDVLTAIKEGAEKPQALAGAALEVMDLDFDRWYA